LSEQLSNGQKLLPGCIYDKGILVYVSEGHEDRYCRELNAQRVIVVEPPVGQPAASAEPVAWIPINLARRDHQEYMLGYGPEMGQTGVHWREDQKCWCYTWDQESCEHMITHVRALPAAPGNEG
jgi:hypothetical protein